jgi:hypothetical protein
MEHDNDESGQKNEHYSGGLIPSHTSSTTHFFEILDGCGRPRAATTSSEHQKAGGAPYLAKTFLSAGLNCRPLLTLTTHLSHLA